MDYHKGENELRIDVRAWLVVKKIDDQYFVRSKDWRMVINYLKQIGLKAVVRKIISRSKESGRNEKYFSIGIGVVNENDSSKNFKVDSTVFFAAYNHPRCVDRLTIDRRFAVELSPDLPAFAQNEIVFFENSNLTLPENLSHAAGWSPLSGIAVDEKTIKKSLEALAAEFQKLITQSKPAQILKTEQQRKTLEQSAASSEPKNTGKTHKAVLFGLGNYAKVTILPFIDQQISIDKIHEVDPMQIGEKDKWDCVLDTSPIPREYEKFDVYFIAGYHHTHQPIALHALQTDAYAVIEKPLATTLQQIEELEKAIDPDHSKYFACFHKRYSPMNELALNDLNVKKGDPVSYHCIVYEVGLPEKHWYRWPNSQSRLTSNGCHWIDHFMFLNDYAAVQNKSLQAAQNGDISVFIELQNGAVFSMILTDTGSDRIGLRDYIELKNGFTTVRMIDSSKYESEDRQKIIRRAKFNPMDNYRRMYQTISRKIIEGQSGDPIKYIESSRLVLELEELL